MRALLYVALGALALGAQAEEAQQGNSVLASQYSTDLLELYKESRLADPRVLSAYAREAAGRDRQRESMGNLLPQLSASSSFNRTSRDDKTQAEQYNNERYALTLSQVLYNKAAWENYQRFKSLAKQGQHELDEAQAEATVDLANRYFMALAADDELELVMAERRTTQKNLDRVKALHDRQMAMVTDVLDLQARVDALAAQEVEARNQVRLSREDLSEIIGRPVREQLSRLREDIALKGTEENVDAWLERALAANPALKARESAVSAAEAALREGKGGHYPSLSLNLSAQRSDIGYDNTLAPETDTYVASLGVQVPLYSGGSTSARVRALYNDQSATEQQYEATRRQVIKETTSAYLTVNSSLDKIRASHKALQSAEQSSIAAERGFQYGVVNAVDVLTSVQSEFKARRDLLKSQYDFITNLLILNRWAGRLSEQNIENANLWLAHVENVRALEREAEE